MTAKSRGLPLHRVEWPTICLIAAVYLGYGLLTWFYHSLPWWLLLPAGGYLMALYGSLLHEAVHGHPTSRTWLNELLVFPSLWLWFPFRLYRELHLTHHNNEILTDPVKDPESYYVTAQAWQRLGPLKRLWLRALNCAAGRLVLGPVNCVWKLYSGAFLRLWAGDRSHLGYWLVHLASVALVLVWVLAICRIPLGAYLLLFVYPAISLTLLRSFLEHQARDDVGTRSVIIEAGPVMSLLYLNNNLHALHHASPGTAWYRLPAHYSARRVEILRTNGGYCFTGYHQVIWRYLFRPKEQPLYPLTSKISAPAG